MLRAVPARALPLTPPIAAPSILSADFTRLADQVALADPARDWVHCDVMDNHFVPNLTFGPLVVEAVRRATSGMVDVHLMIQNPESLVADFVRAGADQLTIHIEADHESGVDGVLDQIRDAGIRTGLALKPGTEFETALPYLAQLDLLLIMTVEPGFGGQSFMADMMSKVTAARDHRERHAHRYLIQVDGGIGPDTAPRARAAGAEVFVAGNSVYRAPDPAAALAALRKAIE
jgi:ribulose-phosphate 3-epimerase